MNIQGSNPHEAARDLVRATPTSGQVSGPYQDNSTYSPVVGMTTLLGNVGGGIYAYKKSGGGFWWTVLGVLVGGTAGNLTGQILTTPIK